MNKETAKSDRHGKIPMAGKHELFGNAHCRAFALFGFMAAIHFHAPAWADLPLTVEDLITDKGKIKLDLSLAYANSTRHGVSTGEPVEVQTGPTSFVIIPTAIGDHNGNRDSLVGTLGFRYGVTHSIEAYVRANYAYNSQRSESVDGINSSSEHLLSDIWAGANYQVKEETESPALLLFGEVALREKRREERASFKAAMFGLTTYKAIDPVVLSLTTGYQINRKWKFSEGTFSDGNLLLLNPSIAFAVNDRITLTTGMQWTSRNAGTENGVDTGYRRTRSDLLLGVGYGFTKSSVLNATLRSGSSSQDGSDFRVNWLHTF